jgi:hypothetical protein
VDVASLRQFDLILFVLVLVVVLVLEIRILSRTKAEEDDEDEDDDDKSVLCNLLWKFTKITLDSRSFIRAVPLA